ncbi:hypothetical protein NDU88_004507 [Pleurodeles waltl]|uniref:Uncharacterized protein n=1 Tax=Pleurodeles waltl TaxID=8319 RepID=A0AAV7PF80_PLEWA|nr:hypothetical protein NDU88_004507 [Pleurodeles waltl]
MCPLAYTFSAFNKGDAHIVDRAELLTRGPRRGERGRGSVKARAREQRVGKRTQEEGLRERKESKTEREWKRASKRKLEKLQKKSAQGCGHARATQNKLDTSHEQETKGRQSHLERRTTILEDPAVFSGWRRSAILPPPCGTLSSSEMVHLRSSAVTHWSLKGFTKKGNSTMHPILVICCASLSLICVT